MATPAKKEKKEHRKDKESKEKEKKDKSSTKKALTRSTNDDRSGDERSSSDHTEDKNKILPAQHLVRETSLAAVLLPAEILLKIFGYLNEHALFRCSRVSRDWRAVSEDDALWAKIYNTKWPEMSAQVMVRPKTSDGKVGTKQKISGKLEGSWTLDDDPGTSGSASAEKDEKKEKKKKAKEEKEKEKAYVPWKRRFIDHCFPGLTTGTKKNTIRIRADRNLFVIGRPGQLLTGEVYMRLVGPLRTQGVFLRWMGIEEGGIVNIGAQAKERYKVQRDTLFQRWKTLIGDVGWDSRSEGDAVLPAGLLSLPFSFEVPSVTETGETLIASFFHMDWRSEYKLSVFVPSKPFSQSAPSNVVIAADSLDHHYSIGMLPCFDHAVLMNSLPLTTTANADPLFGRGDVIVKATIPRTFFVVGETLNVDLELHNNSNRAVKQVRFVLDATVKSGKGAPRTSHIGKVAQTYDQISCEPKKMFSGTLNFTVPMVPPSVHFGKYFHFYYTFSVEVQASMMSATRIVFPITVLGDNSHVVDAPVPLQPVALQKLSVSNQK